MASLGVIFIFLVFIFFATCAPQIVAWQASRFRRAYSDPKALAMADRWMVLDPIDRFLFGTVSRFVALGPEHPEEFPRLIWSIRLMGLIPIILLTLVFMWLSLKENLH